MKAKRSCGVPSGEGREMSDEAFADLKEALEGALAFERGELRELHATRIRDPRPLKKKSPKDSAKIGR
jgi:hypothetical protein